MAPSDDIIRQQAETLFQRVCDQPADEQDAYLDAAIDAPNAVRDEVRALLRAHRMSDGVTLAGPLAAVDPGDLVGTEIGRYKLLEQIGEGGFGVVYRAEQREPVRRPVALKLIKRGMDTKQVIARFEAERQALAMMDHVNIARVFDAGETDTGRPYFVMELVRGVPITEFCDTNNLTPNERLGIFVDVCSAVQHAHQKGVIHRDLKPSNVLITLHDGRPVAKVIDFGIAKATNARLTEKTLFTEFRQFVGTPQYMSPEQAEMSGLDVDTRTDVYALGVLLYELLTGTPPFDPAQLRRAGMAEIQRIIREDEPPRPSVRVSTLGQSLTNVAKQRSTEPATLGRVIRGDLDWIVMTALEKDRRRRYETAEALAADVRRYLDDAPVVAAPPSTTYRLSKFVRRNRVAVVVGAVLLTALTLGISFSTYFAVQASRSLGRAQESEAIATMQRQEAEAAAALATAKAQENELLLYSSMIRAANDAIRNGGGETARRILAACPPEARGWEWTWLQHAAIDHGRVIGTHLVDGVRDVAYSPDGTLLATSGVDRTAQVWDLRSGERVNTLAGHDEVVTGLAFSPDGARLATCSADTTVCVWDLSTGERIATLTGHTSWLAALAFDPTGRWLASCGGNSNLRIWDAQRLELVHVLSGYEHDVWGIDFSPDGERLATCSGRGRLVVWNVAEGKRAWETRAGTQGAWSVRYSPDGTRLVVASFDNRASVWDATDGEHVFDLTGFNLPVRAAAYAPDGRLIVTGGRGGIRTYDAETGAIIDLAMSEQQDIHALDFHPGGERLAVVGTTREVREWDAGALAGPVDFVGHEGLIFESAVAPDGRTIFSVGEDGSLRAWEALTGAPRWMRHVCDGGVYSIDITPDGRRLVTIGADKQLRLWDARSGGVIWSRAMAGGVRNIRVSPDGRFVVAGAAARDGRPNELALWDLEGREIRRFTAHQDHTKRLAFAPDGDRFVSTSADGTTVMWRTGDGARLHELRAPDRGAPNSAVFGPDGDVLHVGHEDGGLSTWNTSDGTLMRSTQVHNAVIGSVCVTVDGRRVLTSAWHNSEVRLFDVATGDLLLELDSGTTGLSDALFMPGESGIVTAGMDGGLRLWELDPPVGMLGIRRDVNLAAREP